MGLFNKKKTEDEKKTADKKKSDKVSPAKKETKKETMKDLYNNDTKKTTKTAEKKSGSGKMVKSSNAYRILVKPVVSEKASNLGVENKYVFEVATSANKIEIAKAIEIVYGIKPVNVNIINKKGKKVRHGRNFGKKKDWKKAIIELPEGKTINIYEGV